LATVCNLRLTGPEIPAFRVFDFVSRLPISQSWERNCRKSPALSAEIPVLRRLSAETGSITTAARWTQSISATDKVLSICLSVSFAPRRFRLKRRVMRPATIVQSCKWITVAAAWNDCKNAIGHTGRHLFCQEGREFWSQGSRTLTSPVANSKCYAFERSSFLSVPFVLVGRPLPSGRSRSTRRRAPATGRAWRLRPRVGRYVCGVCLATDYLCFMLGLAASALELSILRSTMSFSIEARSLSNSVGSGTATVAAAGLSWL